MTSKTVNFNIFNLLLALSMTIAVFSAKADIPHGVFVAEVILGWVISQAITYFTPSGAFVGHGRNWSVGKWISRIGGSVVSIFSLMHDSLIGVTLVATIMPIVEIIVRVYGTDDENQRGAAALAKV